MALAPTSSRGGAAGVSSAAVIQTGSGSPVGVVTPTNKGALYQDSTGGLWVAAGTTNGSWTVAGLSNGNTGEAPGFQLNTSNAFRWVFVMSGDRDDIANIRSTYLGDAYSQWNGHAQGLTWSAGPGEGLETLIVTTGSTGQFSGTLQDGNGNASLPGIVTQKGLRTQAITSGALPTVQLVTATGVQILATRDVETVTPCTFNPGAATTATVTVAISPDNVTYSTLGVETEPAGVAFDGTIHLVKVRVPAGWYLKLTVNAQAVLGLTTYY